jgi:hypothetical protein
MEPGFPQEKMYSRIVAFRVGKHAVVIQMKRIDGCIVKVGSTGRQPYKLVKCSLSPTERSITYPVASPDRDH